MTKEPADAGTMPKDPVNDPQTSRRIHAVLTELSRDLAPDEFDEDHEIIPDKPVEGAMLKEWVLVMAWEVPGGETRLTRWQSENLPEHHENGLLYEALHNWS